MKLPISIIVLTYNGEENIKNCLESARKLSDDIIVVDSGSSDRTLEIARRYTNKIYKHVFQNYARQRNWAQEKLPVKNEWIFHLDQDEEITPRLLRELKKMFSKERLNKINGFLVSRKTVFMGRWIKHGGIYPTYHLRIFRKAAGRCEGERMYSQHFIVRGKIAHLKGDIIDFFMSNLTTMVERHNLWAALEARELTEKRCRGQVKANFFGNPIERRRWLRSKAYKRAPLFLRPFLYFVYRYFLRCGFLDGTPGLIFHFLQGFWQYFLIDANIYERETW